MPRRKQINAEEFALRLAEEVNILSAARELHLAQIIALLQLCIDNGLRDEALEAVKSAKPPEAK